MDKINNFYENLKVMLASSQVTGDYLCDSVFSNDKDVEKIFYKFKEEVIRSILKKMYNETGKNYNREYSNITFRLPYTRYSWVDKFGVVAPYKDGNKTKHFVITRVYLSDTDSCENLWIDGYLTGSLPILRYNYSSDRRRIKATKYMISAIFNELLSKTNTEIGIRDVI